MVHYRNPSGRGSLDRSASVVDNLSATVSNATSDLEEQWDERRSLAEEAGGGVIKSKTFIKHGER